MVLRLMTRTKYQTHRVQLLQDECHLVGRQLCGSLQLLCVGFRGALPRGCAL